MQAGYHYYNGTSQGISFFCLFLNDGLDLQLVYITDMAPLKLMDLCQFTSVKDGVPHL